MQLRRWQAEALADYRQRLQQGAKSTLWEATPGAGKTSAALQLCLHQLREKGRKLVLIVVPTAHLKQQWAAAAARVQLDIDPHFKSHQTLTTDFDGVAVTYQQVANHPALFRALSRRAVVVLDEIHHAGEGLMWGDALLTAFQEAGFVLSLSGTAFRSDNASIPFVDYDRGESRPDYSYGYTRAIEDGVCRPIAFFTYGGEVAWQEAGETVEASFTDDLWGSLAARRLRAALEPDSGWIEPLLREAHQMLQETREEHPEAGGLLVAADQNHARQLGELLQRISGEQPVIVLSDDSAASPKIKRFAASKAAWIVACNMVSEGVDIPRLRVGVYATTISTKMYFRQFLGRMVRMTPNPRRLQVAYVYLPADPRLHRLAEEVELEQKHLIRRRPERAGMELGERPESGDPDLRWSALYSTNSGLESVILNGQQLALWDDPAFAPQPKAVRAQVHKKAEERIQPLTRAEKKGLLAKQIKELVADLHRRSGRPYRDIHRRLNTAQGVYSQAMCTETQLEERVVLVRKMLERAR